MIDLIEQLRSLAQKEETIDQYYTDHDKICNMSALEIERLRNFLRRVVKENSRLRQKVDLLWEENVKRREAIEAHKETLESEKICSYYFDRALWDVLGDQNDT